MEEDVYIDIRLYGVYIYGMGQPYMYAVHAAGTRITCVAYAAGVRSARLGAHQWALIVGFGVRLHARGARMTCVGHRLRAGHDLCRLTRMTCVGHRHARPV